MYHTMQVDMSSAPGDRTQTYYCPRAVYEAAGPGKRALGSSRHRVVVAIGSASPGLSITTPLPQPVFDAVMPDARHVQVEKLIVRPTLQRKVAPVLVIATGPTGTGKTSVLQWAVNEIARRSEGRLAYLSYDPGHFRRWWYGQSEHMVREMGETAIELGRAGHPILISIEDSEELLGSRQWSQRQSCGGTAAATTSCLLNVLDKLRDDPEVACTVFASSNYGANAFDPALLSHRLRGFLKFGVLEPGLVPDVIAAHAPRFEFAEDGITDWLGELLVEPTMLARGRRGNVACEVTLADCLTPSMVSEILQRAHLLADPEPIEREHVRESYVQEFTQLAERIAVHAQGHAGDIGMIVPGLEGGAGDLQLRPAFEPALEIAADAQLDGVVVPA